MTFRTIILLSAAALAIAGCMRHADQRGRLFGPIDEAGKCQKDSPRDGWCSNRWGHEDGAWTPHLKMGVSNCVFGTTKIHDNPGLHEPCEITCPKGGVVPLAGAPVPSYPLHNDWMLKICDAAYAAEARR